MKTEKIKNARTEELIARLAAAYIGHEASPQSLITVRRVELTDYGQAATIFISVLPESEERAAVSFVEHHLGELREYVSAHSDLHTLPYLSVILEPEAKWPIGNK